MRIYVPSTFALATEWLAAGTFSVERAYAVTEALTEWYEQGEEEELEYVAASIAAKESLFLISRESIDPTFRRVVLAFDVPESLTGDEVEPRGGITINGELNFAELQSALIDGDDALADVKSAAALMDRSLAGDGEAQFVVSQVEGHELLWFGPTEIEFVLQVDK
ncbi:MAG: hypothetical protein EBU43_01690 [Actinobacteria bacterium]|jgi:hypothetical protein|nr:hypothetical protein [Actinomycetota bacterium]NBP91054.1 hypothetical protein [Actinomycetota bacterium]